MTIDAHQHFWRLAENDCIWPPPGMAAIHRNFEPADLLPIAKPLGVTGSVLVQSQESDRDTEWLLDVSTGTDFVKAVVGWADLKAPDAPARVAALAARPKLRGLRPMLQGLPDDWILDPALGPAIEAMIAHNLSFDALVDTRHLPHLRAFATRHPGLRIVIDHGAKPAIATGALEPWWREILGIAALPNVFCKLSGLLTEAAPGHRAAALASYVRHLVSAFGPTRLMWGSDWPVLNLAGSYVEWFDMARSLCGLHEAADLDALFRGTASVFYRLTDA